MYSDGPNNLRTHSNKFHLIALMILISIGLAVSYTFGYNSGYNSSEKNSNNIELKDFPDISTLKQFLAENNIDKNTWINDEYTCYTFSTDLVESARLEGYRAQVVVKSDYLNSGVSHARVQFWVESINAWVLVEPQSDGIIGIYTSYTKYGSWIG